MGSGSPSSLCLHLLSLLLSPSTPTTLVKGLCLCYHLLYLEHSHPNYLRDYYLSSSGLFSNTLSQWYLPWKPHLYLQHHPNRCVLHLKLGSPKTEPGQRLTCRDLFENSIPREQKGRARWVKETRREGLPRVCNPAGCFPAVTHPSGALGGSLGNAHQNYTSGGQNQEAFIDPLLPTLWGLAHLNIKPVSMECPGLSIREAPELCAALTQLAKVCQDWSWWQKLGSKRGPWSSPQEEPHSLPCSVFLHCSYQHLKFCFTYIFIQWLSLPATEEAPWGKELSLVHYCIHNTRKGVWQSEHSVYDLQVNEWMNEGKHSFWNTVKDCILVGFNEQKLTDDVHYHTLSCYPQNLSRNNSSNFFHAITKHWPQLNPERQQTKATQKSFRRKQKHI